MADLLIVENGSGGEMVLRGNDLVMVKGIENVPYLSCFGGEEDWWANDYQNPTQTELIWASKVESLLRTIQLNSGGRQSIERAFLDDLAQLKKQTGAIITVQAVIAGANRLEVTIKINELDAKFTWQPDAGFLTYKL